VNVCRSLVDQHFAICWLSFVPDNLTFDYFICVMVVSPDTIAFFLFSFQLLPFKVRHTPIHCQLVKHSIHSQHVSPCNSLDHIVDCRHGRGMIENRKDLRYVKEIFFLTEKKPQFFFCIHVTVSCRSVLVVFGEPRPSSPRLRLFRSVLVNAVLVRRG
jgi:hypothetical protein